MNSYRCTSNQMLLLDKGSNYQNELINIALKVNKNLDREVLLKAVNEEIKRNEGLRLHAFKKWFKWYNVINEKDEINELPYHILNNKNQNEIEEYLDKLCDRTISVKKSLRPFEIHHITCGDCDYLLLKVLHVNMDACAAIITILDIFKVYFALVNNTEMPEELTSVCEYLEKYEKNYESIKAKEKVDNEWNIKLNDDMGVPSYTGCAGNFKGPNQRVKFSVFKYYKVAYYYSKIDAKTVEEINNYCKTSKVNVASLFLSVIEMYYSAVNDRFNDISCFYTANLRAKLSEKKLPLTTSTAIFFRRLIDNELTFDEFIKNCNGDYLTSLKHYGMDISTIMKYLLTAGAKIINVTGRYDELSYGFIPTNYEGIPSEIELTPYLPKDKIGNNFIIYMLSMLNKDGSIDFIYRYFDEIVDQKSIEKLSAGITDIIKMGLDNTNIKVKDIMNRLDKGE